MSALAPADTVRLVKLLGLLGSDHAGERAAAGLKANNLVKDRNTTWADVIVPKLAPPRADPRPQPRAAPGRVHQSRALVLLECGFVWNDWERQFLLSIIRWTGDLTVKQGARLRDLGIAADAWASKQGGGDVDF